MKFARSSFIEVIAITVNHLVLNWNVGLKELTSCVHHLLLETGK